MNDNVVDLIKFCKSYKYIFGYGTGEYACLIKSFLDELNIDLKGFAISDNEGNNNPKEYLGLPVYAISEISRMQKECGIILSLDSKYYAEVEDNLKNLDLSYFYEIRRDLMQDIWFSVNKGALQQPMLKVILGSGGKRNDEWVATDIDTLNILEECDWNKYFLENSIDNLLAEHVWEHLTIEDAEKAAKLCYKYLKHKSVLRIAVPDGYHQNNDYIEYVKPGGFGIGSDDHKVLYTYKTLSALLEKVGFVVNLIEYFDENREIHRNFMSDEYGYISRSCEHDPRNKNGELVYTSIIVDAIKNE